MRNYKAVIMAGGKGTRLLPVTEKIPKPLAPVLNEPLIARTVRLLLRHEITEIAVTLGHLPHLIIDDLTARFDQDFRYYLEKTPLGTAGGVRAATDFLTGPFFVMSGDTETDIDLTDMARFHEDAGCLATVALTHAENPAGFGMVTVQNGIITGFAEKPDKPVGNLINCGIYAFEPEALGLIPQNGPYDFGREFFPMLVKDSEYSAAAYI
ncbi:MAG: nucleotidyltransferase family protein, partial [Firmicutes bacterium]|nr:nucleotidyltransferase family protein [Bacillota bacterium]